MKRLDYPSLLAAAFLLSFPFGAPAQNAASSALSTPAPKQDTESEAATTSDVVVSGEPVPDYSATGGTTAMKSDTPLLDTPQTVTVIPRNLIDDQHDVTLSQALTNVGGVNASGTYRDFDIYSIRGFFGTGYTYLDGLAVDRQVVFQEELFGLDHIEVVQGPASVLYGQNPPGGLVNLISKMPSQENFTTVTLGGDSFDSVEVGLDANRVLNSSGSIYGRAVLLFREMGEFTDYVDSSPRFLFAPSLTLQIDPNTRLTLLGQVLWEDRYFGFPLPAAGTVLPNKNGELSRFLNVGEPDYPNESENWRIQGGYEFEHRFNDVFVLRQNLRAAYHDSNFQGIYATFLEPDQRTLDRYPYIYWTGYTTLGIDTSLLAKFFTGSQIQHTALVGVDFYYLDASTTAGFGSIAPLDLFDPHYGARPMGINQFEDEATNVAATGIYFQEQAKFFDRLTLVAGGRGDFVSNDVNDSMQKIHIDAFDTAFSPRFGAVYEIIPKQVSTYFSYSRSFLSQANYSTLGGEPLSPEEGEQYELGAKADLFEGRLSSTLAFYQITRTNVPTPNLAAPGFYSVTGEQQHRGIDLNTTATPIKGWNIIASYAYIDARVTEDNVIPIGSRPLDVPRNTFHIFTKYTLQDGPLRGFGASVGYRYVTNEEGDANNTFTLPSYGVLDAGLYYARGRFHAQLNINNITDEKYASGSYNNLYVQVGDPLNVQGSVRWDF